MALFFQVFAWLFLTDGPCSMPFPFASSKPLVATRWNIYLYIIMTRSRNLSDLYKHNMCYMCISFQIYLFLLHLCPPRMIVHSQGSLVDDLPGRNSASPGTGLTSWFQRILDLNSKSNKFQDVSRLCLKCQYVNGMQRTRAISKLS